MALLSCIFIRQCIHVLLYQLVTKGYLLLVVEQIYLNMEKAWTVVATRIFKTSSLTFP